MHLFYTPDIDSTTYTLSEEESKHCIRVLRLKESDHVYLVDGKGGFYETVIIEDHPKRCKVLVLDVKQDYGKRKSYVHLAIAPTKSTERIEWLLEKATEIGIDEVTPLLCERSERRELKTERLNKVVESAMKQSIKAYHPRINEMTSFLDFVQKEQDALKLIAHCVDSDKRSFAESVAGKPARYLVLIGPEGDFSEKEIDLALKNGFSPISLGESRLRTETAALVATVMCNML